MPIYEIRCNNCGNKKEVICKFSEIFENATCPICGQMMTLKPSKVCFNIEGHSFANGYNSQPELDTCYDGTSQTWEP